MKGQSGNAETSRAIGADAGWAPPENPDPQDILAQAKQDTASGRYEDALAKHLWFHENALEYRSSLYGVRLSFALGDWTKLSHVYPLA